MMPVIVIAVMLVVQVGLAYYTRQVVSGAMQDGAATGAMYGFAPSQGDATAQDSDRPESRASDDGRRRRCR